MLQVDEVGSGLVEDALKQSFHLGVAVAVARRGEVPSVHRLEIRDSVEFAPGEFVLGAFGADLGEEQGDLMAAGAKRLRQVVGVDFASGEMTGQKLMNDHQDL